MSNNGSQASAQSTNQRGTSRPTKKVIASMVQGLERNIEHIVRPLICCPLMCMSGPSRNVLGQLVCELEVKTDQKLKGNKGNSMLTIAIHG